MKIELNDKKYPTVRNMLRYIVDNDIPMDAVVTCEQLMDYYLEDKFEDNHKSWDYYEVQADEYVNEEGDTIQIFNKLIPAHNGFGSAFNKRLFVIWIQS